MDIGRTIKKYDVFYVGGIADPCVILSADNALFDRYLVAPVVTDCNMKNLDKTKAELIVNNQRQNGKIYVPVRLEKNSYKFVDIAQLRPVTSKTIQGYYKSINNPDIKDRLDKELDFFIKGVHSQFKYTDDSVEVDASSVIRKFDIWCCHFANRTNNYVVLQSDMLNMDNPQQYIVAPVYSESPKPITSENLRDYMKHMEENGNICIPFRMTDKNEYSFINLSNIHYAPINRFKSFEGSIINKDIREFIDDSMMRMFFDNVNKSSMRDYTSIIKEEAPKAAEKPVVADKQEVKEPVVTNVVEHKEPEKVENKIPAKTAVEEKKAAEKPKVDLNTYPDEWEYVYSEVSKGVFTELQGAELLNLTVDEFTFLKGKYINETKTAKRRGKRPMEIPKGFDVLYEKHKRGKLSISQIAKRIDVSMSTASRMVKKFEDMEAQKAVAAV